MQTEARTEQPDGIPDDMGVANEPSTLFLFLLWVPVFAVVSWGMMLLMGRRPWEFRDPDPLAPPRPGPDSPGEEGPEDPPRESA